MSAALQVQAKDAGQNVSFPCHAILATIPSFKNAGEQTRQKLGEARTICHEGALAFAKLQELMTGRPILFPGQQIINAAITIFHGDTLHLAITVYQNFFG